MRPIGREPTVPISPMASPIAAAVSNPLGFIEPARCAAVGVKAIAVPSPSQLRRLGEAMARPIATNPAAKAAEMNRIAYTAGSPAITSVGSPTIEWYSGGYRPTVVGTSASTVELPSSGAQFAVRVAIVAKHG